MMSFVRRRINVTAAPSQPDAYVLLLLMLLLVLLLLQMHTHTRSQVYIILMFSPTKNGNHFDKRPVVV